MAAVKSSSSQQILMDLQRSVDDGSNASNTQITTTTTTTQNIGDRVVDVSLIPFARVRPVIVVCENLRPNMDWFRVYWGDNPLDQLDDEIWFGSYTNEKGVPIGSSENWDQWKGSTYVNLALPTGKQTIQFVKTDSAGYAKFAIYVPEGVPVGDSIVEIRNEADLYAGLGGKSSRANTIYRAHGLRQQKDQTIITTQVVTIKDVQTPPPPPHEDPPIDPPPTVVYACDQLYDLSELPDPSELPLELGEREIFEFHPIYMGSVTKYSARCRGRTYQVDPLAQSFMTYSEPVYISSIELYFKTKPASSVTPITIQIREVINGYPGPKIIPGSTLTKTSSEVSVSVDATTPTVFQFVDPVYLQEGTEYCIVVMAFTTEYELWTSEIGQRDVSTNVMIDRQPVLGSLFTSQNNRTWTAEQNFDLKFRINKCSFNTDGVNEFVNFAPMTGAEAYTFIQRTSMMMLSSGQLVHPGTSINWYYKYDETASGPSYTSLGLTNDWRLFEPGLNLDLQNMTNQVLLRMEFSGGTLSPVIDKNRLGIVFLKNKNNGTYISKTMDFGAIEPENLKPNYARILFNAKIPANTSVSLYCAVDDDIQGENNIDWNFIATITSSVNTLSDISLTGCSANLTTDEITLSSSDKLFFTGQPFSMNTTIGGLTSGNTYYAIYVSNDRIKVAESEIAALSGSAFNITASGSCDLTRHSLTRIKSSSLPGGITQYDVDYDLRGLLNYYDRDGVDRFKFKIELNADEGYQYVTPLIYSLMMYCLKRV